MPEGNGGRVSRRLHEAPLSSAFRQAWHEWLDAWNELPKDNDDEQRVEVVAELSTQIAQRLWRSAFAKVGDAAAEQVKAVVYAFVALVDETLLYSAWPGQLAWQEKPLESRMYASRQAGERLPMAIQAVLDEQSPTSRDLANVYLQCLILGFQGRLRGEQNQNLHEKWRLALFEFAWQHEADYADVAQRLERPAAVEPVRLPVRLSLPDGFRLGLAIVGMLLVMSVVGHLFWRDIGQQLEPVMQLTDVEGDS
ncbi:DotU family type IV/VI secretion system protein [Pseudomonas chlororaphis]|uniref:DotU family type IV/VI secretion system protein n=1 Tax=Pseudomonas chlororaphis TaxID=587753 RepID=UPI0003D2D8BE|nr:DotU/TssL family secretion system protein [Pseudomonas chlororaphis]AZD29222.1 Inner membrane protein DotU [Pseudomonas chlororaphis]ETD37838.1 type VI secretion system protein ImpK [Pseudomonas chlororaphis subsp. aurantiaca PB-St2]QFS54731.1 DotU family type IV/VI secretion system protein [Pseudomonas chlororaphis subsp. aurantiaca]